MRIGLDEIHLELFGGGGMLSMEKIQESTNDSARLLNSRSTHQLNDYDKRSFPKRRHLDSSQK